MSKLLKEAFAIFLVLCLIIGAAIAFIIIGAILAQLWFPLFLLFLVFLVALVIAVINNAHLL